MLLVIGAVARPHGVRGEVSVEVRTDAPAERFAAGSVLSTDPPTAGPLTVQHARAHQGRMLVSFEEIADRGEAERLRGVLLCVDSSEIPEPADPDEFNDYQLVGLRAEAPDGTALGEIVRVDHAPASDLLVLRRPGGHEALVPFVRAIVPEIDLAAGRIVIDPPGGLLDL